MAALENSGDVEQRLKAGCQRDCSHTGDAHARVIEEIAAIGEEQNRHDVLESFCTVMLRGYVCRSHETMSAKELFDHLRDAVDCREEIHELERTMDKNHFVELVTGGYFMSGGVDKKTNLPIFWIQSGLMDRNSWKYTYGSPRGNAFARCVSMHFDRQEHMLENKTLYSERVAA